MLIRPVIYSLTRSIIRALNGASIGFYVGQLFANGEQGVWYDPSDFSTLFQDAAGTTPVTAVEQPVGLMLDKRLGLVRGVEVVTNGAGIVGTTGWTAAGSGLPTLVESGGALTLTSTAIGSLVATNTGTLLAGVTYELIVNVVSRNFSAVIRTSSGGLDSIPLTLNVGLNRFIATPTTTGAINVGNVGSVPSGSTITFNLVSAKSISGNHATQTTAAARPVLSARKNLLLATETLATQSVTLLAASHVLSFTGTGTITLTGASTAGPLVGTGANDRVWMAFTPTAGSVTFTVSGAVTKAQLEHGS